MGRSLLAVTHRSSMHIEAHHELAAGKLPGQHRAICAAADKHMLEGAEASLNLMGSKACDGGWVFPEQHCIPVLRRAHADGC